MDHVFLHADLDAFFASVEQLDNPEWKGLPVIVGGIPGDRRSVVSTASYEARKYGVHSAMPVFQAVKLCPNGIFVHGRHKRYQEKSSEVMQIFSEFSPDVIQISVDEAFIDLTGTERLFGDPEKTARRIKEEVKTRTGLTVSIGMASTKYVAKIASGLSKPDGFFLVPAGEEINFMLSLPLEKVWGVGTKTLERLNSSGFRTTKDIYKCSTALLISIFGKAGGTFLYNAVRGNEAETFTNEAKTHQLSSENTFDYDLTDIYAIETALLELAHTVMFRMLREKVISHTVSLKIRYEDFTTVSVQETYEQEISSVDDLFEHAKKLFIKKYVGGKGIRLLGLGVQNIEQLSSPRQVNLFDFGEEKKKKIERAILKAEQKDPSVKIQKARLLGKKELLFIFAFSFFFASHIHKTYSEETVTETDATGAGAIVFDTSNLSPAEDGVSLFSYNIGDKDVEFIASGYWQSTIKNTSSYSFGFGSTPGASTGVPVFSQEVDLSLWFLLNKHFYFESSFADGFEKNTVAAGYYGDGILKEARIANRGIIFPSTYSVDDVNYGLGGGDNQAPGMSFHFESDTWKADAVLRYDMLEAEDKTWYGKNSVSEDTIALSSYLTGSQYILPNQTDAEAVNGVYVESSSGTYKDTQGRTYKKLDTTEYLVLPSSCEIIISSDAGAAVKSGVVPAVAFSFDSSLVSVSDSGLALGTFGTAALVDSESFTGSDFLGDIQKWFGSQCDDGDIPNVASYSYGSYGKTDGSSGPGPDSTGAETDGFFTTINDTTVLLVQHPAGFSPFAVAYRYDCGTTSATDAVISSAQTGTSSSVYLATTAEDDTSFVSEDFFSSTHTYVDVYSENKTSSSAVDPQVRFPIADTDPGIYLGSGRKNDLILSVRTYTAVERFDIGTKAVSGTVRVYKNGVIDSGAVYDEKAGTITLSTSVNSSDHIYATWYEDSSSSDSGAIAAAAGFRKIFSPTLSGDISLSARWSYVPDKEYADSGYSSPGFLTLATGIIKQTDSYKINNTAAATLESDNTTGTYRVLGMSDSYTGTVYLSSGAAVDLPSDFAPTLNSRPDSSDTMPTLDTSLDCSVSAETGKTDSGISGYAVPISWDFTEKDNSTSVSSSTPAWACTAINLPGTSSVLASASTFSIALKNSGDFSNISGTTDSDLSIYLQLGVDADDDFSVEDSSTIPTWLISKVSSSSSKTSVSDKSSDVSTNPTDVLKSFITDADYSQTDNKNGWQTITVVLSGEDRARLAAHYDARLIICSSNPSNINIKSGTIYAGPYEAGDPSFDMTENDATTVSGCQQTDSTLSSSKINKFNSGTNYVQHFEWSTDTSELTSLSSTDSFDLTFTRYFEEADMTPYTTISLWFKYTPGDTTEVTNSNSIEISDYALKFILDRPQSSGTYKESLSLSIDSTALSSSTQWHQLTIDRKKGKAYIDGDEISSYALKTNADVIPVRFKITVNGANPSNNIDSKTANVYCDGSFDIDELSFSDSSPHFILQDTATASWKKDGSLVSFKDKPVVSNVSLDASGTAASTIYTSGTDSPDGSLSGNAGAKATVAGFDISADAAHSADASSILSSGGHSIQTAAPLLGTFSFGEEYRFSNTEQSLEKNNSAAINLSKIHIPLAVSASTSAQSTVWSQTQNAKADASLSAGQFSLVASASAKQKIKSSEDSDETEGSSTYISGWDDSTKLAFSTGCSDAYKRIISGGGTCSFSLPSFSKYSVDFLTTETYVSSTSIKYSDETSVSLNIPFSLAKNSFSFSWEKTGGGVSLASEGGSYSRDTDELFNTLQNRQWFFKSIPFYDLFSTQLSEKILDDSSLTTDSDESLYYTGKYTAQWKRSFTGSGRDFYVPSNISFSAARDIRTSSTTSDLYQLKALFGWTALNVFGTAGTLPVFSWFKQDEYTSSLSATFKIPKTTPSNTTVKCTGYIQSQYYMTDTNTLKTGAEGSFETTDTWSGKLTIVWKRAGKMSPVLSAITLFKPEFDAEKVKITRTDSMNLSFSEYESSSTTNSKVIKKQSYELTHLLELAITKYITVNGSISGSYASTWGTVVTLSASASIGCKIKF